MSIWFKRNVFGVFIFRFRDTSPELELTADIVPPFRDDIQLTVAEYRSKLYEIMSTSEKKSALEKKYDRVNSDYRFAINNNR